MNIILFLSVFIGMIFPQTPNKNQTKCTVVEPLNTSVVSLSCGTATNSPFFLDIPKSEYTIENCDTVILARIPKDVGGGKIISKLIFDPTQASYCKITKTEAAIKACRKAIIENFCGSDNYCRLPSTAFQQLADCAQ